MDDGVALGPVPGATRGLVLVSNPRVNQRWDFELVARHVHDLAPDVQTAVVEDGPVRAATFPPAFDLPTMTFSPGPLRRFWPPRGPVFHGVSLPKSREYRALEQAGVPVPRWSVVTRDATPDLDGFGPYVVMKPDWSGRGADVRIVRRGRVRWRPPTTEYTRAVSGREPDWIVQEFVYTGTRPVSYRVATLFGEPIWAWAVSAAERLPELHHRYGFGAGGMSIVASGKGCVFRLIDDPDILALASAAHQAFPAIPLLGVDVLRDLETGRLYVIEV
ncbi:MAG TPA: hypothetical protein VHE80_04200, partial [Acidimicrobiales bacterium]|nr:hypothetical protein [Acidimicrobiales bacterium]